MAYYSTGNMWLIFAQCS